MIACPAGMVSDDEDQEEDAIEEHKNEKIHTNFQRLTPTSFNLDGPTTSAPLPVMVENEEDRVSTNDVSELLRCHHQFAYISF